MTLLHFQNHLGTLHKACSSRKTHTLLLAQVLALILCTFFVNVKCDEDIIGGYLTESPSLGYEEQYGCTFMNDTSAVYKPNITAISFTNTGLHDIPPNTFHNLTNLKCLLMDQNNLTILPDHLFQNLQHLEVLDMKENHLTNLPSDIFHPLVRLHYLDLSSNSISTLPNYIFDSLYSTFYLNVSYNQLTMLPTGTFTELRRINGTLDLSYNSLISLPTETFSSLNLIDCDTTLDLSHNKLTILPNTTCTSLTQMNGTLDLSHNKLVTLPDGIFTTLVDIGGTLDISNNNLTTLPKAIFSSLQELRGTLDLSQNKLATLPDEIFTSLARMGTLNISHNMLTTLPVEMFRSLTGDSKTIIDISYNDFDSIPGDTFSSMEGLLLLDLDHNALSQLQADSFAECYNLKSLSLKRNRLQLNSSLIFKSLTSLQVLDLGYNAINQLPINLLNWTTNLVKLDLCANSLETLHSSALTRLTALKYLNVSHNILSTLPELGTLKDLTVLDLSFNRIQMLTAGSFSNLESLKLLSLAENQILNLPTETFHTLQNLAFINVSYNGIRAVHSNAFGNTHETIDLRGNTLDKIKHNSFNKINNLNSVILVENYATCCFIHDAQCISQEARPAYLTCGRMLPDLYVNISMWLIGVLACITNVIAFFLQRQKQQANKVQTLLISNLSLSDLLIGINMLILVIVNLYYNEYFPSYAKLWRQGFTCKLAGFLSILSCEGSVFFITLISIDRFLAIKYRYPYGRIRFSLKHAQISAALAWFVAILIAVISIVFLNEEGDIFFISEVCIGIPIVRSHITREENYPIDINKIEFDSKFEYDHVTFNEHSYQSNVTSIVHRVTGSSTAPIFPIIIFIGLNLLCFSVVAVCYIKIFQMVRKSSTKQSGARAQRQAHKEEIRMASRMFALVFTDFCCWVPLCTTCILAQAQVTDISPKTYAWIVGFVLPINSSINPFLYVILGEILDYWKKRKGDQNARQQIELQHRDKNR